MGIIKAEGLVHEFIRRDEENNVESITTALDHVDLDIEPGKFIAILGHNGSGKSTLAKHINALLSPTEGTLWVDGMDVSEENHVIPVRKSAGMVFQNPDNQIIASVVEEDVAFGPENIGIPTDEITERVKKSLESVGMTKYSMHSPNKLSGGQKQRVAIAGVLAMEPKCIVFDEPTAMLDPNGRKEVLATAHQLNKEKGVTILWITHYMEEVIDADYVYVMEAGNIVMQGTARDLFSNVAKLKEHRLDVPQITLVADCLRKWNFPIAEGILSIDEFVEALSKVPNTAAQYAKVPEEYQSQNWKVSKAKEKKLADALILDHVSYVYNSDTTYAVKALNDVNLTIEPGQFVGIIGHTGSGKSTLIQHLNGLLKATEGHLYYKGEDTYEKRYDMRKLRNHVGLVFQYPEYQLFETTVFADVCFGPKNQKLSQKEVELRAFDALSSVHFPEELFYQPPFDLSGGQKRRVAIAGVLAMKPDVLILDEPTAGLDPAGRDEILNLIAGMHEELKITVILVSHSMEDVAKYVDRIIVMNAGEVMYDDVPREVFGHYKQLEEVGLSAPQVTYLVHELSKRGLPVRLDVTTAQEAAAAIIEAIL